MLEQDFSFHRGFGKASGDGRKWLNKPFTHHRIRPKPQRDGNKCQPGLDTRSKPQRDGNKCQPGHRHSIKPDSGWEPPLSGSYWLHTSKILILQDCNVSIDIEGVLAAMDSVWALFAVLYIENQGTSAPMERLPATYGFRHHRGLDNFCQDGKPYSPELQTGLSLHPR